MWSLGCVLAELVILRPVLEGEDTGDQLASIVDILGVPSDEDLENMRVEDNMLAQAVRASQVSFHQILLNTFRTKINRNRNQPKY